MKLSFIITCLLLVGTVHKGLSQNDSEVSGFENYIHSTVKNIVENCKITTQVTESDFVELPLGISPQGCSGTTVIVIDSAYRAERGGAFFSAYASVIIPGTSKPLAFSARNIGFGEGGLFATTEIRLVLVSPQRIPVNDNLTLEIPADGHNFIEFDCNGFKSINLKGNFIFSERLLLPDTDIDKKATSVTASFEINTHDLNNIITSITITPFKIRGVDDLSFIVNHATLDFSDIANPIDFSFPQEYQHTFGEDIKLWRGFYLHDLTVNIKSFSNAEGSARPPIIINAHNLLIDDLGVSGVFSAMNLLPLKEGSADGWPFSIDMLAMKVQYNQLMGGTLEGSLGIPLLGEKPLPYQALVEQEFGQVNYRFSVAISDSMEFKTPLSATVKLKEGSTITFEKRGQGNLTPSALLNGSLSLSGKVNASDLKFEGLGLTSRPPYITSGTFSTTSNDNSKMSNFPIQIDKIGLQVFQGRAAIGMDVSLNFMAQNDKGFSASTHVDVLAKIEVENQEIQHGDLPPETVTKQHWNFEKVVISTIALDCQLSVMNMKGYINMYDDDPVYGTGFQGSLALTIQKVLEKPIKVNAYFGSKEFRYWHMDGYVPTMNAPIPPAFAITGFMGGASYKMTRQQKFVPDFANLSEDRAKEMNATDDEQMTFIPDENAGLSFLAGVTLIAGNERALNADVMLEINFNQGGGVKYMRFDGSAFFLTPIQSRGRMKNGESPASSIYANMSMLYDNDNDVFHANMKTYINIAGVLMGTGANGLVGEAVIHADKHDWYAYIGRPTSMFGVSVLGFANAQTYFMTGTKIENLPLPPPEVRNIFQGMNMSLMRDDLAAAGGKGFATGAHFAMGFDSKKTLTPFYVVLKIGAGTDVMLRDYGTAQCVGQDGTIGINGWYASGQAYVFLVGKVGIRVGGKPFDIVNLGLAALLQAKLPNPSWMRGTLAGNYKILGGLVKGKFNLAFEVGDECQLANPGAELENIVIIEDLSPATGGQDVSVFAAPQVSFNTFIGKDFSMMGLDDNLNAYRIAFDEFTLTRNGSKLNTTISWNEQHDVAVLNTPDILPASTLLKTFVKIHWEKKTNGLWEPIRNADNTIIYETKEGSFTTGKAPDFIPDENIAYSYPIKQQFNLYIDESGEGYVQMNYPQEYLFAASDSLGEWEYVVQLKDQKGKSSEVPLAFSSSESRVQFNFPTLENQSLYTLKFIKRPVSAGDIDSNVKRSEVELDAGDGNEVRLASNTLQGSIAQAVEKEIYQSVFRTSIYPTFAEKWNSLRNDRDAFDVGIGNMAIIGRHWNTQEVFDDFELNYNGKSPLINIVATKNNAWLKDNMIPLLYEYYPVDNDIKITRKPEDLGLIPLKAVAWQSSISNLKLTDRAMSSGKADNANGTLTLGYYLSFYVYHDYADLKNAVATKYFDQNHVPEGARRLMSSTGYTDLLKGNYPVDITYSLPGAKRPSFQTTVDIKF